MDKKQSRILPQSLSKIQRDVLAGLLLGDGHLETQNGGRTYRLKVEHGLKQRDYVQWLYNIFSEWVPNGIYTKNRKNGLKSVGFTTQSHATFRFYGQQFYGKNRKRHVPVLIKKIITPISIAVWFMDDGSRKSLQHNTYNIHTLGYSKKDLEIMQDVLLKIFNIQTHLHKQKGKYYRIYILSESAKRFTDLIKKYISPIRSMKHKLVTKMPKE